MEQVPSNENVDYSFVARRNARERQQSIDEFARQFAVVDNTRKAMVRREAERILTNDRLEEVARTIGFDATIKIIGQRNRIAPPERHN